jgi:predicted DNA-binding protein (MmcQ/YjbR family)
MLPKPGAALGCDGCDGAFCVVISLAVLFERMDIEWLRNLCLSLPHATEQIQWGDNLVFKVGGKIFAVAPLEPAELCLSFKCSDEDFAELIERPGIVPAPYLARAHWVALESEDPLGQRELEALLRQAHSLVFAKLPKKLREKLERAAPATASGTVAAKTCRSSRSPARKRLNAAGKNSGVEKN